MNLSNAKINHSKCPKPPSKSRVNTPMLIRNLTLTIQNGLHDISTCLTFLTLTKMEKLVLMNWSSKQTQKYAKQLKLHRNKRRDNKKCVEDFFGGAGLKYGVETH